MSALQVVPATPRPCPAWCVLAEDEHGSADLDGSRYHEGPGQFVEIVPGGNPFLVQIVQCDNDGRASIHVDGGGYFDPSQVHHLVAALYALQRAAATQDYTGTLGGRVRAACARRGLTQGGLADRLGVSGMWVSQRVTGKRPWTEDELERVAEVLEVEVDELLGRRP